MIPAVLKFKLNRAGSAGPERPTLSGLTGQFEVGCTGSSTKRRLVKGSANAMQMLGKHLQSSLNTCPLDSAHKLLDIYWFSLNGVR